MPVAYVEIPYTPLPGEAVAPGLMAPIFRTVRLGAIIPEVLPPVLRFRNYRTLPMAVPPPERTDRASQALPALRRMYGNDRLGDCVIASAYHQIGLWTGNDMPKVPIQGTDAEVVGMYHAICGPGDNGCDIAAVLNYTRTKGLPAGGVIHRIDGYVSVDHTDKVETQVASYLFATLKLGIDLPQEWANSARQGFVWDLTNSRIVGGHDVPVIDYTPEGVIVSTWAVTGMITWRAFMARTWVKLCYAVLSPDWYGSDKLAPMGIDAATLKIDLAKLADGEIPPLPEPVPPLPPPIPTPVPPGTLVGEFTVPAGTYQIRRVS